MAGALGIKRDFIAGLEQTQSELQAGLAGTDDRNTLHESGSFLFHELGDGRCGHLGSHGRIAAINGKIGSGDEGSMAGAEKHNRLSYFLRLANPAKKMEWSADAVGLFLVAMGDFVHKAAPGPAGRNGIDADLVCSQ